MAAGRGAVLGELVADHDVHFGAGDAAAVDGVDAKGGSQAEGGGGVAEDGGVDAGVEECAEEHVTADAGKAIEVRDSHRVIVADGREGWEVASRRL